LFTGVASAQSNQPQTGSLHDYMEKALAEKLNISVSTVEAQFDSGKSLSQIALDNGIAQADLPTFMLAVRTQAIQASVSDGFITQAQADRMLQKGARGMGSGMRYGGNALCNGTGNPAGSMMQRGGRFQQSKP
jgi:hypothetical protein